MSLMGPLGVKTSGNQCARIRSALPQSRRPLPSAPILAITAAHATTKHLTSNHHDNDGSTPPFHRTAGQRLPVSVRRTPPWE